MSDRTFTSMCALTLVLALGLLAYNVARISQDNSMIVSHIEHGATFPQAYCAVHDPKNIVECSNKIKKGPVTISLVQLYDWY